MNLQEPGPVANAHTANIRNTTPPIKVTATNWEKKKITTIIIVHFNEMIFF